MSKAMGTALALLLVGLALGMLSLAPQPARAASVSYDLYGSAANGWGLTSTTETNPGPALNFNIGDAVTITLHSTDGLPHQLLIDYNGNGAADPGEPLSSQFTSTTTLTFTATQAGSFRYLCTIHGSAMEGTANVQGTGTPSYGSSPSVLLIVGIVIAVAVIAGVSVLVLRSRH